MGKSLGFTAVAVLTLALGIGANTAVFSLVNAVLLRPLPYRDADRILHLFGPALDTGNFDRWNQQSQSYEKIAALSLGVVDLTGVGVPERLRSLFVSVDLFPLLDLQPALGRKFLPEEYKADGKPVVIVSHRFWRRQLASTANILGHRLTLDGLSYTVVGVMPPMVGPLPYQRIDVWLPLRPARPQHTSVLARLKPGVTLEEARAEADVIARRLLTQLPVRRTQSLIHVERLKDRILGDSRLLLLLLEGAAGFVLLVACINVANLLLARLAGRDHEIAIRAALGASRSRLVRQLLTESLLLSGLGSGMGLLMAQWGVEFLLFLLPYNIPRIEQSQVDSGVLAFTLCLTVITALFSGLVPALRMSGADILSTIQAGVRGATAGARHRQLTGALIVSEVALALVMLIGAGLLIKTFLVLRPSNPGFDAENKLTMALTLPTGRYPQPSQQAHFLRQVIERLSHISGVRAVAAVSDLPFTGLSIVPDISIHGQVVAGPGRGVLVHYRACTPDFFRVMGMPVSRGRDFSDADDEGAPRLAVINQTTAQRFWPNESAVGQSIRIEWPGAPVEFTVVGVVRDARIFGTTTSARPELYVPVWQAPLARMTLVVHTTDDPQKKVSVVRDVVRAVDPNILVTDIEPIDQLLYDSVAYPRFHAVLMGVFAGLALILALVGIYSVIANWVSQRTQEIGIRLALGAQPGDILRLVVCQGLGLTLAGISLGLPAALVLTMYLKSLLFEVPANDPETFVAVTMLWLVVALLACYIPAWRATRVDPVIVLKYE